MIRFDCENCAKTTLADFIVVTTALLDGYKVGDRVLEEVMFRITIDDDELKAEIREDCAEYFKTLNRKMWLKNIHKALNSGDLDDCHLTCETCGDDIAVIREDDPPKAGQSAKNRVGK